VSNIQSHHLIYGTCIDFLTGEELVDTDDERCRQRIARWLVEDLGYEKDAIVPRLVVTTSFAQRTTESRIDFAVRCEGRIFMIIRYAPGSLVTRERAAVAAARVLVPEHRVPLAVVINGPEAELIDSADGRVLGNGLAAIPTKAKALEIIASLNFAPPADEGKKQRELRLLNAFDFEECCAGTTCVASE
jgi:hypothetical protein